MGADIERVTFDVEHGPTLEGELRLPETVPRGSAVLCHPHPLKGGSKDHPLLWAVRNELASRGLAVLSFNFRGVMGSGGEYGHGVAEVDDARAALGLARDRAGGPTLLCGWSFGATVALRLAIREERVSALALIGMPLGDSGADLPVLPPREELAGFGRPVLLLAGEADPFSPVPELKSLGRRLPRSEVAIVPGTDHFFWRREGEVATIVGEFADRALAGSST